MEDRFCLKTIRERLKSETPKFWKTIRNWMIAIGGLGAALGALPDDQTAWLLQLSWVPDHLFAAMTTIGVTGTFLASLTRKDPPTDQP